MMAGSRTAVRARARARARARVGAGIMTRAMTGVRNETRADMRMGPGATGPRDVGRRGDGRFEPRVCVQGGSGCVRVKGEPKRRRWTADSRINGIDRTGVMELG